MADHGIATVSGRLTGSDIIETTATGCGTSSTIVTTAATGGAHAHHDENGAVGRRCGRNDGDRGRARWTVRGTRSDGEWIDCLQVCCCTVLALTSALLIFMTSLQWYLLTYAKLTR